MSTKLAWKLNTGVLRQTDHVTGTSAQALQCPKSRILRWAHQLTSLHKNNASQEIKLKSSYSQGKSSATSVIGLKLRENGHHQRRKTDKEWHKRMLRAQQSNMQPDLRRHICEHSIRVLLHQICCVLSKKNTIGCKCLNDVKPETAHQSQTLLCGAQLHNNIHLSFRYNPVEDYRLSQHVLISTMSKVYPYCNALKFKGETKGMFCTAEKIKLPLLGEPPEPLKTLPVTYTAG
ncbi:uncharacterized protein TNCV_4431881 [Trichonephila clavipes]|nr:uncharacterized protein TNCV_4431881 [Trichonephila clavipes]